ncbi:hypothetical protein [Arenimonas sp. SCN 70-307]|uniref:hypothetical protein n=1 Tax=Arenimonas sp. SCN 70-307 TaxID=1660089 RepID=UPI0025BFC9A0|nr:hypothetical protein [Arenimonas sp. SCN 70-307]
MANFLNSFLLFLGCLLISRPAGATDKLSLEIQLSDQTISVVLVNEGDDSVNGSRGYFLSGLSGGNVIPVVVTELGQLMPPCGHMDYLPEKMEVVPIGSGQQVVVWRGTAKIIAGLHCLEEGKYALAFSYMAPDGSLVFTGSSVALVVGKKFSARAEPISGGSGRL